VKDPEEQTATQKEINTSFLNDQLCLVPSHFFFYEVIEVDSDLSLDEQEDFIQLQIESISPFPIEQILYGYFVIPNSPNCVLYLALKDRLNAKGFNALDSYTWVIPDSIIELSQNTALFEHSAIKEILLKNIRKEYDLQVLKEGDIVITDPNAYGIEAPNLTCDQLWTADIRPIEFKEKTKKDRSRLAFLNKAFQYSLYFFALIFIAELGLIVAKTWLSAHASRIEAQAPAVSRIEDQHTLINKLDQIAQNELRPIALLEHANAIRTKLGSNIVYDDVDIVGENEVTIKGSAGSVNQFNAYVKQLEQSGYFVISEDPKYVTRGGKTTFTLKMNYQHSENG
jgi:hypothetical protein